MWLCRASAFLCWFCRISSAVRTSSLAEGRWSSHQQGINAPRAVWTWHSVTSGFFFPQVLSHPRQEQETDRADHQMTFQSQVSSALVVIQAHLSFLVLEATLHVPPREAHQQHRGDRGLRSRVADEELDLPGIQDISSDQQVQRFAREAVLILGEEPGVLDLPNHRPFLPILDPPTSPGLVPEFAPVEPFVPPSAAPSRPVNSGLGDLVLIANCLYDAIW